MPLAAVAAMLVGCASTSGAQSQAPVVEDISRATISRIDGLMRDAIRDQHVAAVSLAIARKG